MYLNLHIKSPEIKKTRRVNYNELDIIPFKFECIVDHMIIQVL